MLPPSVSDTAEQFATLEAQIAAAALAVLAPAIRRGRRSPVAWRDAVQSVGDRLIVLQVSAASYADAYLNDVLKAQGADTVSEGRVNAGAFGNLADGVGSWLQSLVYAPNSVRGKGSQADWTRFQFVANSIVKTGIGDSARSAVQTGMQARPAVLGYVRMLRGKSCARCAILAGRKYRAEVAFRRHKRCDCVHVPTGANSDGWITDPKDYFASLSTEDQDRTFTKSGAEAIRLGANAAQVVNAQAGVGVVTSRSLAGQRLGLKRGQTGARLLPDDIFQLAELEGWDRAEVLRQLKRFAYIV